MSDENRPDSPDQPDSGQPTPEPGRPEGGWWWSEPTEPKPAGGEVLGGGPALPPEPTRPLTPPSSAPASPFGPPQFGPPQSGPPQFGPPQFGPPPYGPPPYGSPPYGGSPFGGPLPSGPPSQPRLSGGLLAALVVLLVVVAAVAGGTAGYLAGERRPAPVYDAASALPPAPSAGPSATSRPASSIAGIAARVQPAVVSIDVRTRSGGGTGSGFVIRPDGYILTNNHVIADAAGGGGTIVVQFQNQKELAGHVVGRDAGYDLAVVKVDAANLPALPLGNSDDVRVGDEVIAVGSPLRLAGTVTFGIISALNRLVVSQPDATSSESSYALALQTDAAINPGNSGGPLIDMQGRVIGVNSAIATLGSDFGGQSGSIGLGFSIPINKARDVADQLIRTGHAVHPIIGVLLDTTYQGGDGAKVATRASGTTPPVSPGSPADRAGIRPGDLITRVDDLRITSNEELIATIRAHSPGDHVQLSVTANGQSRTVEVTLTSSATG